ncbi:hypothetical protein [Caulobacter sp.]|uniref:hypothetical protein n=1 Tax=Caulobacter sp. TaxID=78 RepID=UPI003BB1599B
MLAALALPGGHAAAQAPIAADLPVTLNPEDAARYFPDRAWRLGISSWARVRCVPDDRGQLADCVVVGEGRPDLGFGQNLIKLTRIMRVPADVRARVAGKPSYVFYAFPAPGGSDRAADIDPVQAPARATIEAARPNDAEPIGMATVRCRVALAQPDRFYDCAAIAEFPVGQGYGAAAVSLAQAYRLGLETPDEVEVRLSTHSAWSMQGPPQWDASVNPWNLGLALAPTSGPGAADLPTAYMVLTCRWAPDGRLRKCRPNRYRMQPVPRKIAKRATALLPQMRLVREVMFNVNWGQ